MDNVIRTRSDGPPAGSVADVVVRSRRQCGLIHRIFDSGVQVYSGELACRKYLCSRLRKTEISGWPGGPFEKSQYFCRWGTVTWKLRRISVYAEDHKSFPEGIL